jgi:peptidyl-dipeptidase A
LLDSGLHDVGVSWRRANYGDDNTQPMVDKLYEDILPLYKQLHAFVRHKLVDYYSDYNLDPDDPIPAHILGSY